MIAIRPLVAHVVHRFAVGGLENGIVNLVNRLSPSCWRHAIIALDEVSDEFASRIRRDDVPFFSLRKRPGHTMKMFPRLYRVFRTLRPSIVHTRNLGTLEAALPAWAARVPVRIHGEHGRDVGDLDGSNRTYRLMRRACTPFVTRYVALSRDLERYLIDAVRVSRRNVVQIYNGVDTERFYPVSSDRITIPGCPFTDPRSWLVGTVGRMAAVKDQTNLARAFAQLVRSDSAVSDRLRLVIVGEGALRQEAEAVLVAQGVRDLAWFAGERDDVPAILRGLNCFVMPSLAEGISNTILEAMASGLPVVATRVGGNAELIEEHSTGLLVPASDSKTLAAGIATYFRDREMARRHGLAGRRRAETHFSLDAMISRYDELYRRALQARRIPVDSTPQSSPAKSPSPLAGEGRGEA
jgi:sugar transferase (PEP-CTERM/EpsH1 system associated)